MKTHLNNLFIAFLITIIPVLFLFAPLILNYNKSGSNTRLLGQDYSYLSRSEIISRINQNFILPEQINLELNDQKFTISTASISANIDTNRTAGNILYRRLDEGIVNYVKYFFNKKDFNLTVSYDTDQLSKTIETISSQFNQPFVPTELVVKNKLISTTTGSIGVVIDQQQLQEQIISNLSLGKFNESISIKTNLVGSIPNNDQISQTISRAQKLIGKSITLITSSDKVVVDDLTLISWLDFNNGYQTEKISTYSQNLSKSLQHDPIDAVFKFENGKVLEFQSAKNGVGVNSDKLSQEIITAFSNLENSSDSKTEFNLSYESIPPKINNSDVNNLGIKELIGSGTSTFKHSSATRNINIAKGSSIINRLLVAPNETFSFVKSLGEVTLEAGYAKAYIIRAGKTELDVGGGVCQVSTTFFRAILNAGLDITERKAHAYRVSYYEEDSKPGFDATVFIPSPDLKFINDTGHYILIQSVLDMENRRLTYEIYGTSDGRKAEISNYRQWDATPAPPAVWIDDPTLPVGKTVQDEHAVPGLKTAFDWTVTDKNGKVIHQKTFQSNFVPWAAVYRRGPAN